MASYRGFNLVAIDLQTPILWSPELKIRKEILQGVIGHATHIHIRIPFNPTANMNQLEALLDEIMGFGFMYRDCVSSHYGSYYQTWIFGK